jgi:hypothetical protein
MIERILDNIIGLAAMGLFGIGLYEWYRRENRAKKEAQIIIDSAAKRAEINAEIKKIQEAEIAVKEDYNKKKENVYEIIKKRSSTDSDTNRNA